MSKIGKKSINIPKGVQVQIENRGIIVKGPKGELRQLLPATIKISVDGEKLSVSGSGLEISGRQGKQNAADWGLFRALIRNMIIGASDGFQKSLELQGIGYKAVPKGADLELSLGFSHPIIYKAPSGVSFKVEKNVITIIGNDKKTVGQTAAELRAMRKPEPYKGSGVRYSGEIIRKKAGKKAIATGG